RRRAERLREQLEHGATPVVRAEDEAEPIVDGLDARQEDLQPLLREVGLDEIPRQHADARARDDAPPDRLDRPEARELRERDRLALRRVAPVAEERETIVDVDERVRGRVADRLERQLLEERRRADEHVVLAMQA